MRPTNIRSGHMRSFVRKTGSNLILILFCISYAAFILWGAAEIPPAFFDPLGSAAVPIGCAILILLLSTLLVLQSLRQKTTVATEDPSDLGYRQRWDKAAGIVLLTVCFIGSMSLGLLGYDTAAAAFTFGAVILLGGISKQVCIVAAVLAILMGFGGHYLFTEIFYIDLPS